MPLYAFYGLDKPGALELRKATRPAHLEWVATFGPAVKVGGPMLADDGATPIGSLIVMEFASLDEAKAAFAQDPYAKAGLWESAQVRPFNWILKT
jgi:uncharacterized protein YciI